MCLPFKLKIQLYILRVLILSFLVAILPLSNVSAQQKYPTTDTVAPQTDTDIFRHPPKPFKEQIDHPDTIHYPGMAMLKSAIIPGWAQLYNKKWWKVPLIYSGLSALTVTMVYNQRNYDRYLNLYHYFQDPSKVTVRSKDYVYFEKLVKYNNTAASIADAVNSSQRDFQLGILGFVGLWGLQVVDAYIDAKFRHSFSVDNQLSFRISPDIMKQPVYSAATRAAFIPAVKITFTI